MKKLLLPITALCLISVPSCGLLNIDGTPLTFEAVVEANGLRIEEPGTSVIRNQSSWQAFWGTYTSQAPPEVDFSQKMVIGVFWGAGYSGSQNRVEAITTIEAYRNRVEVNVGPIPVDYSLAIKYPIELILVDHYDSRVVFNGKVP